MKVVFIHDAINYNNCKQTNQIKFKQMNMKQNAIQYENNVDSFKRQTLQLLKQQAQKIRQTNAIMSTKQQQLMIKQEQINFLKQSIKQLENDNLNLIQENNQLKNKLDRIVQEITNYNQNIVKPICQEKQYLKINNQQLKNQNHQIQKQLITYQTQYKEQISKNQQTKSQIIKLQSLLKQQKVKSLEHQQKIYKQTSKSNKLNEEILRITQLLKRQHLNRDKIQMENNALTKQLNSLVTKCNQLTKQYELKISQIKSKSIDKSQILIYEQLVRKTQQQNSQISKQLNSMALLTQQLKKKYAQIKQKSTKQIIKLNARYNELTTDILNLKKSIQIQKKVVEFQSQNSQTFYAIYKTYQEKNIQLSQLKQQYQQCTQQNSQLKTTVQKLSHALHDSQIQQTLLKTQLQEQMQRLQSSYEGKLISLNLKIKAQQEGLQKLKKRQIQAMQENQKLYEQLQKTKVDFIMYKQTSQKSLSRVNGQNYQIVSEMQQLYKMCQQNVDSKRILDRIKYVVNSLVTAIYYFQLLAIRSRQKQRKIYMPFVTFYLQISNKINKLSLDLQPQIKQKNQSFNFKSNQSKYNNSPNQQPKNKRIKIRKLKSCVWTVIAAIRIRNKTQHKQNKKAQNLDSIGYKIWKGLNRRSKTHNTRQILQKQGQILTKKQDVEQIINDVLKVTKNAYDWDELNYKRLIIQTPKYLSFVQTLSEKLNNNKIQQNKTQNQ